MSVKNVIRLCFYATFFIVEQFDFRKFFFVKMKSGTINKRQTVQYYPKRIVIFIYNINTVKLIENVTFFSNSKAIRFQVVQ